jgi:hypothetical protein
MGWSTHRKGNAFLLLNVVERKQYNSECKGIMFLYRLTPYTIQTVWTLPILVAVVKPRETCEFEQHTWRCVRIGCDQTNQQKSAAYKQTRSTKVRHWHGRILNPHSPKWMLLRQVSAGNQTCLQRGCHTTTSTYSDNNRMTWKNMWLTSEGASFPCYTPYKFHLCQRNLAMGNGRPAGHRPT